MRVYHLLIVALFLFSSASQATDLTLQQVDSGPTTTASTLQAKIVEGVPPLMCGDLVCALKDRSHESLPEDRLVPVEDHGWWYAYGPDQDWNGMDDRLQRILVGEYESVSATAIMGSDGRKTVAIVVDYAWHPSEPDVTILEELLYSYGWVGQDGGSRLIVFDSVDRITVDKVPVSALLDIWSLDGVVVVEQQNVMVPMLDMSVPTTNVRADESGVPRAHEMEDEGRAGDRYRGDGVVIAILDTGVDNEHRSLNDFDDVNDDPDADASNYADPKFVCGFDATQFGADPNRQDCEDPDDENGHGTHVAGTALGTGGSERRYVGAAPGAYLVDVKVLTGTGGTNSDSTSLGIQWAINNVESDWGGDSTSPISNDSAQGIQIISMSLGAFGNPVSQDDTGDNGSGISATMSNRAHEAGIVVVAAMGNDGQQRVPSPASADHAISVGSIDDNDNTNRDDDVIAGYSNWGPRQDDGDEDTWDELKPTITAPGTGIMAPNYAPPNPIPIGDPELADNEYQSLDGTSMATPHVAGLIAVMLQKYPSMVGTEDDPPVSVRELLEDNSESKGGVTHPSLNSNWNEKYGFGMVDASMWIDGPMVEDWMLLQVPETLYPWNVGDEDRPYLIAGTNAAFRGNLTSLSNNETTHISYDMYYMREDQLEKETQNQRWISLDEPNGTAEVQEDGIFFLTVPIPDDIHKNSDPVVFIRLVIAGLNSTGSASEVPKSFDYFYGRYGFSLDTPTGITSLAGLVEMSGDRTGFGDYAIEMRTSDDGDWQNLANFSSSPDWFCMELKDSNANQEWYPECYSGDDNPQDNEEPWSADWDTAEESNGERILPDGRHTLSVRLVGENDYISDVISRDVIIDNDPPAPELILAQNVIISQNGVEKSSAFKETYLKIDVEIQNIGDARIRDVPIQLREDSALRNEVNLPILEAGESTWISLYWNPTTSGVKTLEVVIDPANTNTQDSEFGNTVSIDFTINERPAGVDLSVLPGTIRTSPDIPYPSTFFDLEIPVYNIGSEAATSIALKVEYESDLGWEILEEVNISVIPGGALSKVKITLLASDPGLMHLRITAQPPIDLDWDNNAQTYWVPVIEGTLAGSRSIGVLGSDGVPLSHTISGSEGHMISVDANQLSVHRVNDLLDVQTCRTDLEGRWGGSLATATSNDGLSHIVWTGRVVDEFGFFRTHLRYTTIDESCQSPPSIELMPPLLASEGSYFGIDLEVEDGTVVVAGYHRDIFAGGTYQQSTDIFLTHSDTAYDQDNWTVTKPVIADVPTLPGTIHPLDVEIGEDFIHLLYTRNHVDDPGIWYAHGELGQSNWLFTQFVGPSAHHPVLAVHSSEEGDEIFTTWIVDEGDLDRLVITEADSSWQITNETSILAPGINRVLLVTVDDEILVVMDSLDPLGESQIGLGSISEDGAGFGIRLMLGTLVDADYSSESDKLVILYTRGDSDHRLRGLVYDSPTDTSSSNIFDRLRVALGVDASTWRTISLAGGGLCILANLLLVGLIIIRRRSSTSEISVVMGTDSDDIEVLPEEAISVRLEDEDVRGDVSVVIEDDVVEPDIEEDTDSESSEPLSERAERRRRRAEKEKQASLLRDLPPPPAPGELALDSDSMPLPPPPGDPSISGLPPPPDPSSMGVLNREVSCSACGAVFNVKGAHLMRISCPVCDESLEV
ncbi:MAG: S8 family serine peptidase [Candidatus Thalassarchaeaceae archaeon]